MSALILTYTYRGGKNKKGVGPCQCKIEAFTVTVKSI